MKTRSESVATNATDPFADLDAGIRIVSSLRLGLVLALTVVPWSFSGAQEIDWSGRARQDIAAAYRAAMEGGAARGAAQRLQLLFLGRRADPAPAGLELRRRGV